VERVGYDEKKDLRETVTSRSAIKLPTQRDELSNHDLSITTLSTSFNCTPQSPLFKIRPILFKIPLETTATLSYILPLNSPASLRSRASFRHTLLCSAGKPKPQFLRAYQNCASENVLRLAKKQQLCLPPRLLTRPNGPMPAHIPNYQ
jgi:hypothetical protein